MRASDKVRWPCWARSSSRPGVPTTTSTPVPQRLDLRLVGPAAVDGEHAGAEPLAGTREVGRDLHGQLAGRGDDQGLRLGAVAARQREPVEQRHAEAQRLAGAGAGLADQVVAGQRDRQRELLDRERAGDADVGQRLDDLGLDVEVAERRAVLADRRAGREGGAAPGRGRRRRSRSVRWSVSAGESAPVSLVMRSPSVAVRRPWCCWCACDPLGGRRADLRAISAVNAQIRKCVCGPSLAGTPDSLPNVPSREAVVDLLGALAYGELSAFDHLADDAGLAPTLPGGPRCRRWPRASSGTTTASPTGCAPSAPCPTDAMAPVRRRARELPRAHRAVDLAGERRQGLRRGRDGGRLLPRGRRVRRRRHRRSDPRGGGRGRPGRVRGAARCRRRWPISRPSPAGSRCGRAGWSGRRSARPSTCWPTATR